MRDYKFAIKDLRGLAMFEHREEFIHTMDVESINLAIEALEKQIPKKIEITDSFHTFDDGTQEPHKEYQCPTCKRILSIIGTHGYMRGHFGAWYCEYCGQALDWTDIKEAE